MLTLPSSLRVFAKTGPTDMRKSFEGLVGVVERELGQQVESGDLLLFFNRRGDRVKVLWFAGDGLVIWYKRLEGGTFEVPKAPPERAGGRLRLACGNRDAPQRFGGRGGWRLAESRRREKTASDERVTPSSEA
jgi:hypothetical protein